jgi:K+-sensing histidine kinase KdpD
VADPGHNDELDELQDEEAEREALERKIDRSWMLRLEAILSQRSPGFVVVAGLLLLLMVGLVDAVTGKFEAAVFYFVPIALVTFARGRGIGLLMAGVAAIGWSAVEVFQHVTSVASSVTYWNGLTRFYAFAAIVLLIAPMRQAMVMQRQLAEKEAEAAAQLRALNELREMALMLGSEGPGNPEAPRRPEELLDALSALDRDTSGARYGRSLDQA